MSKHFKSATTADLVRYGKAWDRALDALFFGHKPKARCPLRKKYGDTICIDGTLWELTYSEMAPPDSRQNAGPCPYCSKPEAFEPTDDVPDDETYCALYCAEERRAWEDCALVGGCPLARKGDLP